MKPVIKFSMVDGTALEDDGAVAVFISRETAIEIGHHKCPHGFSVRKYIARGELRGYTLRKHSNRKALENHSAQEADYAS